MGLMWDGLWIGIQWFWIHGAAAAAAAVDAVVQGRIVDIADIHTAAVVVGRELDYTRRGVGCIDRQAHHIVAKAGRFALIVLDYQHIDDVGVIEDRVVVAVLVVAAVLAVVVG